MALGTEMLVKICNTTQHNTTQHNRHHSSTAVSCERHTL